MNLLLQILYQEGAIESWDTLEGSQGGGVFYWVVLKGDRELIVSENGAYFVLTQKGI